jgi:threonine dehydrogenase-like Zn-dependent dehydrogenase
MRAAITDGRGGLWLDDVAVPRPTAYQCLCRIEACATCSGTDLKHVAGKLPFRVAYPAVLGHESVGMVVEVGPRVRYLKAGDRVLRPCAVYPGEKLGPWFSAWGGFAEYGLVTDCAAMREDDPTAKPNDYTRYQQVVPVDLGLESAEATMLITLKETASTVAGAGVGLFRSAAVLGAGSVGLSMCLFARLFGAWPVIAVARRDEPLEHARRIGASFAINAVREDAVDRIRELTDGRGVDRLLDTTGSSPFLKDMLPALASDGKVVPYATYESADALGAAIPAEQIVPATPREDAAHPYMINAVRMGVVRLRDFYSHRLPLADIVEGFQMLRRKEAFKIVFET